MQNVFLALKQDTHDKHTTLEHTSPFSLFNDLSEFNLASYADVLNVMSVFHQTTASHVADALSETPMLLPLSKMLNSQDVEIALKQDTQTLSQILERNAYPFYRSELKFEQNAIQDTHEKIDHANLDATTVDVLMDSLTFRSKKSAAIAAAYVWLGSSMGANIITRRLMQVDEKIPTRYYSTMAGCAKTWVSFKQGVENLLPALQLNDENGISAIVDDANTWFSFLIALGEVQSSQNQ